MNIILIPTFSIYNIFNKLFSIKQRPFFKRKDLIGGGCTRFLISFGINILPPLLMKFLFPKLLILRIFALILTLIFTLADYFNPKFGGISAVCECCRRGYEIGAAAKLASKEHIESVYRGGDFNIDIIPWVFAAAYTIFYFG